MLPVLSMCTPYSLLIAQGQDLRNTAIIEAKPCPRIYGNTPSAPPVVYML